MYSIQMDFLISFRQCVQNESKKSKTRREKGPKSATKRKAEEESNLQNNDVHLDLQTAEEAKNLEDLIESKLESNDSLTDSLKKRKKPRWSEEKKEAARKEREQLQAKKAASECPTEAKERNGIAELIELKNSNERDASALEGKEKKKKKKTDKIEVLAPEERISGPSNADEAHRLRATLGFEVDNPVPSAEGNIVLESEDKGFDLKTDVDHSDLFNFGFACNNNDHQIKGNGARKPKPSMPSLSEEDGDSDGSSSSSSLASSSSSEESDSPRSEVQFHSKEKEQQENEDVVSKGTTDVGDDDVYVPRRVYVGGMPYSYTENQIREYWEYCGPIESLDMLTFPDTGRFRGIAFITFQTEEGFQSALACDGEYCEEQTVKVKRCKRPAHEINDIRNHKGSNLEDYGTDIKVDTQKKTHSWNKKEEDTQQHENRSPAPKVAGYFCAYVGNIAWEADAKMIEKLFEGFGATKIRLHTDKITGKPKGYAHVHFR